MVGLHLKKQTSPNPEILLHFQSSVINFNKTKIVLILPFCCIKVLTIGIGRNELPILIIVLPIPIPILI